MNDKVDMTVLCCADSGCGKTSALRNLDLSKVCYVNVDSKPIPFKHAELNKNISLDSTQQLINGMEQIESDESIEYCVIDTITFLGDMFYTEHIENSSNGMKAWGDYKSYILKIINMAKRSRINYIFLAHAQDIYDDKEMVNKTFSRIQGSLKGGGLEGHFTYVLYNIVKPDADGMPEYLYLTNKTKGYVGVSAKTPFDMIETWIPNDITLFHDAVKAYHQ